MKKLLIISIAAFIASSYADAPRENNPLLEYRLTALEGLTPRKVAFLLEGSQHPHEKNSPSHTNVKIHHYLEHPRKEAYNKRLFIRLYDQGLRGTEGLFLSTNSLQANEERLHALRHLEELPDLSDYREQTSMLQANNTHFINEDQMIQLYQRFRSQHSNLKTVFKMKAISYIKNKPAGQNTIGRGT